MHKDMSRPATQLRQVERLRHTQPCQHRHQTSLRNEPNTRLRLLRRHQQKIQRSEIKEAMNNILTHACSLKEHPVSGLTKDVRINYIKSLASVLRKIWENNEQAKILLFAFTRCIDDTATNICNEQNSSGDTKITDKELKKAIKTGNTWWKFWCTKYNYFFFDCFYLASQDESEKTLKQVYNILECHCNSSYADRLKLVYKAFCNHNASECIGISDLQRMIYKESMHFHNTPEKKVLIVATVSAGKSTLINAMVGKNVCKTANEACTQDIYYIRNKPNDGVTIKVLKDSSYHIVDDEIGDYKILSTHFNSQLENIILIDTPGVNNASTNEHHNITLEAVGKNDYDILLYISNCQYNGTTDESILLTEIKSKCKKKILFVLNQLDRFNSKEDSISKMLESYRNILASIGFGNPNILLTSGYAAYLTKMRYELDDDDLFQLNLFEKKFAKDFFNLPQYTNVQSD